MEIGVIVGRSGSGKTSIAKQLRSLARISEVLSTQIGVCSMIFPKEYETSEITRMLCSVGFSSPPDWLKSYNCFSQGEKMRVDIPERFVLQDQRSCLCLMSSHQLWTEKSLKSVPTPLVRQFKHSKK